jgi:hypothetical protein
VLVFSRIMAKSKSLIDLIKDFVALAVVNQVMAKIMLNPVLCNQCLIKYTLCTSCAV